MKSSLKIFKGISAKANFVFLASLFSSTLTIAGSVSGPHVVWVNLDSSANGERVNKIVASFASDRSTRCNGSWFTGTSLLYMKKRPPKISNTLVADVFLKGKIPEKKLLNEALKSYIDEYAYDGFDGIIVYDNSRDAEMMQLTTGHKRIEKFAVALKGKQPEKKDIEAAFCVLLPPITRKP